MVDDETLRIIDGLRALASELGDAGLALAASTLRDRATADEWFVLVVGEFSAGKTTWVNSLLDEQLLPVTPSETSAVATEVRFGSLDAPRFEVRIAGRWRDVERHVLVARAAAPEDAERLRVTWPRHRVRVEARGTLADVPGLVLVDTPGGNGLDPAREDELARVLPEADALLLVLNWRNGVRPEDLRIAGAVPALSREERPPLLAAINWGPPQGGGHAKAQRMEAMLREELPGVEVQCEMLTTSEAKDGEHRIWSGLLWERLVAIAKAPERAALVRANLLSLAARVHLELARVVEARASVASGDAENLRAIEARIGALRDLRQKAHAEIEVAKGSMRETTRRVLDDARGAAWRNIDAAISDAGRFTEARLCGAHVGEVLLPRHYDNATHALVTRLEEDAARLAERFEKLLPDVDEVDVPMAGLDAPQWAGVRNLAAAKGLHRLAYGGAGRYLGALGGAAGQEAGLMNLAKKMVSKIGHAFGKTFPRSVYNNMGRSLRALGLSARLAKTAVAAIVVEAAAYLYHVARWKQKLRGVVQHTLELPPSEEPVEDALLRKLPIFGGQPALPFTALRGEAEKRIDEALDAAREMVAENVGRRVSVLEGALEARRKGTLRVEDAAAQAQRLGELGRALTEAGGTNEQR